MKARRLIQEQFDTTRPICYESGGAFYEGVGRTELTDVICTMYPDVPRTIGLATRSDDDRPVVLCEYSHAMGNSNGNLHLYWKEFWNPDIPRLQGGYIWDMVDQGLRLPCEDHPDGFYYGYGGDFGDKCNDLQFCINGMFSPDREPHPAVTEIKFLQQPAVFWPLGGEPKDGSVSTQTLKIQVGHGEPVVSVVLGVTNRLTFRDLSHLAWSWHLTCDRATKSIHVESFDLTSSGEKAILKLEAAVPKIRQLENKKTSPSSIGPYFLNLRGFLKSKSLWAEAGYVLVTQQFPVTFDFKEPIPRDVLKSVSADEHPGLRVVKDKTSIRVFKNGCSEGPPLATVESSTASLVCYAPAGQNLLLMEDGLSGGVLPNFTRAGTDNDKGGLDDELERLFPGKESVIIG